MMITTIAENSCVNCRFELTCGYSPLAMLKKAQTTAADHAC